MMFLHCSFLWILFAVVDSHSPLTEKKAENGISVKSSCESNEIVINNLQNQINQETLIRLSLLKQVYSLVNDMINVKNEMAAMKNNAEEVRKSTDDLRLEDKKMLNEIEKMKHDHNDTSERIMNVQHEHDKMLSEIEQKMKINQNETSETIGNVQHEYKTMFSEIGQRMKYNHNATSERIVNVQNDLLNVNNSVGFLRNFTDKVYAKYGIQENKMRDLSTMQEKIQSTLGELRNEDQRILSETQRIIANRSENTFEKILKMREDLERNITYMVNNMTGPLERQDCLESSHCWLLYNFSYDASWNGCEGGSQYVTKTNYSSAPYLGVMTCNSTRYKLFLSKTATGIYYNIADNSGNGQDHCELLGSAQEGVMPGDFRKAPTTQGFYRHRRGQQFSFGKIGSTPTSTPRFLEKWIECGVSLPGSDRVIRM